MEGARFLALLLYFEGRVEGRGAIAPLKREALQFPGQQRRYAKSTRDLVAKGLSLLIFAITPTWLFNVWVLKVNSPRNNFNISILTSKLTFQSHSGFRQFPLGLRNYPSDVNSRVMFSNTKLLTS